MRLSYTVLSLACFLLFTSSYCLGDVAVRDGQKVDGNKPSFVKELTDDNFEHDTQASTGSTTGDWFVEFYAPWCGHCKSLAPVWSDLSAWVREEQIPISIAMLDATTSVRTAKRLDIRGFPSLKILSKGQVYDYTGARTLADFQKYIENKEWLLPGVTSKPMPAELSTADFVKDYVRETANDLVMLATRKPGGAAILMGIGVLVGILVSMLVFIVFLEKKPIVHQVGIGPVPPSAKNSNSLQPTNTSDAASSSTNATTSSKTIPKTNAGAKKAE